MTDQQETWKDLWAGKVGKRDMSPHRIQVKERARPIRLQTYRTGLRNRQLIAEQVAKKTQIGVIEPSQFEWSLPVVIALKSDGTPWFCMALLPSE